MPVYYYSLWCLPRMYFLSAQTGVRLVGSMSTCLQYDLPEEVLSHSGYPHKARWFFAAYTKLDQKKGSTFSLMIMADSPLRSRQEFLPDDLSM